jgi:prophage regulatory protein
MTEQFPAHFLRLPEVVRRTGLQRDSIYRLGKAGRFPKPVKLSERASGWVLSEVEAWAASRAAERGAA